MFGGSYSGLVNGLVILVTDIKDHNGTIVTTSGDKSSSVRVEINAHDTRLSGELVFRPGEILNGVTAN